MNRHLWMCALLLVTTLSGCIRKELPNAEADILSCTPAAEGILSQPPIIENDNITLHLRPGISLRDQALHMTLTPGATIVPASGSVLDFRSPQIYTVTSEDGLWRKQYRVTMISGGLSSQYSFEQLSPEQSERYHTFVELRPDGAVAMTWASGNSGFALSGQAKTPADYPTVQVAEGHKGRALKLETRSTGFFGGLLGRPIAAGNLFIGSFDASKALAEPLEATHFGLPFIGRPKTMKGYYKYQSGNGSLFRKGKSVAKGEFVDKCSVYAVFYETDEGLSTLNGGNVLTHPNIISVAQLADQGDVAEWRAFEIPFVVRPGKVIDAAKLAAGGYNLAIVFSSSELGAEFTGAVGSILYIDEVEIVYEEI